MKRKSHILFVLFLLTLSVGYAQDYSSIQFIENKGQWDSRVKYKADLSAGSLYMHEDGFTVVQHLSSDWDQLRELTHSHGNSKHNDNRDSLKGGGERQVTVRSHAYRVRFLNASRPVFTADKPLHNYNNYFIGNDPSKWASNCRIYQGLTVSNIYPGIDIRYYSSNGTLKYDIIVKPGADLSRVALQYEGVDKLDVKNKELVIKTSVGELRELYPYSYQYLPEGKKEVPAKYQVTNNTVRFNLKEYDPKSTLVIDPTIVFCSFSGSSAENWGFTATYGNDGSMYGGGIVNAQGFPTSPGAFQTVHGGGKNWDIGIIKLSPNGDTRIYATYIGGTENEQPHSLVADAEGNLIIAGRTNSPNYPTKNPVRTEEGSGYDIVVTKLNATGTALIGSKKIGGTGNDGVNVSPNRDGPTHLQRNYGDDGRSEVILDGAGNIYVASATQSDNFPKGTAPVGTAFSGMQDGILLKLSPDVSNLIYSRYIGGRDYDAAYVLSLHPFNNSIYIAGGTQSNNLPTTAGALYPTFLGDIDGYVMQISNDGASVLRSTYMGTPGKDQVFGIQFDRFGYPYIMGQTTGNWRVVAPPENPNPWNQPNGRQFIAKLQSDLSAFVYSTTFGTGGADPNISPVAFLVDRCENVYVSGWGGNLKYPSSGTDGLPVVNNIKPNTDGQDFYFFVLKRNATEQLYGDFFGQNGGFADHVDGGTSRFDKDGVIYMAICADCPPGSNRPPDRFPTTLGAWGYTKPANVCNLAMVKIALDLAGVRSAIRASIGGNLRDTAGCVPLKVDFSDTALNANSYEWDFGDGSPRVISSGPDTSHVFTRVGTYRVMLIAIDSLSCNIRDTSYQNIRVGDLEAKLNFTMTKEEPCEAFTYSFTNTSTAPGTQPFNSRSFIWDFGDGTRRPAGPERVFHTYRGPGTYNVRLVLNDSAFCNYPDSLQIPMSVATNVQAVFETPPTGCAPYTTRFSNTSVGGQQFFWNFGDGATSTERSPVHTFLSPGTYTITLIAADPNTCNKTDTSRFTIQVYDLPTADFSAAPQPPTVNSPISFTNLSSSDAVRFKWLFGDGDSLVTTSRGSVSHEYEATGNWDVLLIAINSAGCADTVSRRVQSLVEPLVDVPNAFTPGSSDNNNRVFVRGFGIAKMKFVIWSRWGEKVFETDSKRVGWDGQFKGKLLPMDVYAYTLEVEFGDGTRTTRTGDITLIR